MAISPKIVDHILHLFIHMHLINLKSIQDYNPIEEYRKFYLIGKGLKHNSSAEEVYCHTDKLTPWQLNIFNKRKKEIPHESYIEHYEEHEVFRIGFRH